MTDHTIARINPNGRIVIPAAFRKALGLESGDAVALTLENGRIRIEPHRARLGRLQQDFAPFAPTQTRASEELTKQGRSEVRRQVEEWLG